jgi:chemotaxis protein methyltransferase CheR
MVHELSDHDFGRFQRFLFDKAGISLSPAKKALVVGRLARRLDERQLSGFGDYFDLLASGGEPAEVQIALDLLTTNETYFFREQKHFDVLRRQALQHPPGTGPFRVWSAASSTGEEAYSIAMVLEDCLGNGRWEVVGSDISTRVLAQAQRGHYAAPRTTRIPPEYLKRFCLRGVGEQEGTVLVQRSLRSRVRFFQANLNAALPSGFGMFDVIFLRNVLIYFNVETKRQVVARVLAQLKPGGVFFVGHSESLNGVNDTVRAEGPAIYRKE